MSRPPLHRRMSLFGANGRRMIAVLMVAAVGVLVAVPATAGANVSKAHAKEHKKKLVHCSHRMKAPHIEFDNAVFAVNAVVVGIQGAIGHPEELAQAEAGALQFRRSRQEIIKEDRARTDKDIAGFRAKAVTWFPPKTARADTKSFEAALKHVKTGFSELLESNRLLNGALLALGVGADFTTANDKIFAAGGVALTAQMSFDGLKGLRKLP